MNTSHYEYGLVDVNALMVVQNEKNAKMKDQSNITARK